MSLSLRKEGINIVCRTINNYMHVGKREEGSVANYPWLWRNKVERLGTTSLDDY